MNKLKDKMPFSITVLIMQILFPLSTLVSGFEDKATFFMGLLFSIILIIFRKKCHEWCYALKDVGGGFSFLLFSPFILPVLAVVNICEICKSDNFKRNICNFFVQSCDYSNNNSKKTEQILENYFNISNELYYKILKENAVNIDNTAYDLVKFYVKSSKNFLNITPELRRTLVVNRENKIYLYDGNESKYQEAVYMPHNQVELIKVYIANDLNLIIELLQKPEEITKEKAKKISWRYYQKAKEEMSSFNNKLYLINEAIKYNSEEMEFYCYKAEMLMFAHTIFTNIEFGKFRNEIEELLSKITLTSSNDKTFQIQAEYETLVNDDDNKAIELAEKGLELNPNNSTLLFLLSNLHIDAENYFSAEKYSALCISKVKQNSISDEHPLLKNREQALEHLYMNHAQSSFMLKHYDSAISDYNEVLSIIKNSYSFGDYKSWEIYDMRGLAYYLSNNYEMAIRDYKQAIEKAKTCIKNGYSIVSTSSELIVDLNEFIEKRFQEINDIENELGEKFDSNTNDNILEEQEKILEETLSIEENNIAEVCHKINLIDCTKDELLSIECISENMAEKIITEREDGKNYYSAESIMNEFNLQPHEQIELEERIIFPEKPKTRIGRKIDW